MINFESSKIIINIDMYRGFQLVNLFPSFSNFIKDVSTLPEIMEKNKEWKEFIQSNKNIVEEAIDVCFLDDGSIDGSRMQENWFPQVKADIFISHSHGDKELAQELSKWLYMTFGLKAFIDSDIWGYAPVLEEELLCDYPYYSSQEEEEELKKFVSAHVHMMLSIALNQMIDNTECLFFLNTPNSISINAPIDGTTPSPWIYSEVAMSRLIRKIVPKRYKRKIVSLNERQKVFSAQPIRYTLPMDHLTKLSVGDLQEWKEECKECSCRSHTALDYLYKLKPLKRL